MVRVAIVLASATFLVETAHAQGTTEIYKCLDEKGRPSYTNDRRETENKKCELVTRQVNVAPATKAPAGSPGFPKETTAERASAREKQRQVLEKELATEQAALGKAQQDLAAQEAIRNGDERNYARVEERLQPYKDSVETHEKNIEALKRELANLYK